MGELRLPRAVIGPLGSGAALGAGRCDLPVRVRNPLGSPDVLGFTQGATAGALIVIVSFSGCGTALTAGRWWAGW